MHRPIWTGAISFGLVNVPIRLFTAVAHKEVRFHMVHDADAARIHLKRVCSAEDEEVPYEHIVKGYEVARGRYVTITPEELEALDPKRSRSIDISDFVDLSDIDPIYYESTYYVVPAEGAERAYALLFAAMTRTKKVAIARMVMRTKQYLCAVRPMDGVLTLSTMSYADEIVPASEYEGVPVKASPNEREMKLAEQLIDTLVGPFEPQRYKDEHRERVLELIERKAAGEEVALPPPPAPAAAPVDLMSALRASLGQPGRRPSKPARAAGRARATRATPRRRAARAPATPARNR